MATSDWHFRLTTPRSRAEEDWKAVQFEALYQIAQLCREHDCPVVIAGDVLDDGWRADKCPPELINEAYEILCLFPHVYAVAGQHDLPNHRLDLFGKSALHTLSLTGKVTILDWQHPQIFGGLVLTGFSWGELRQAPPEPAKVRDVNSGSRLMNVAAIHANVWHNDTTKHKESRDDESVGAWRKKLKGYDVAVFGDNHKGFLTPRKDGGPVIYNTGGPLNRNSDEKGVKRHVGLVFDDGSVDKHYLNTSSERWKDAEDALTDPAAKLTDTEFITDLAAVGPEFLDFVSSVMRHLRKKNVRDEVQRLVTDILKKAKE